MFRHLKIKEEEEIILTNIITEEVFSIHFETILIHDGSRKTLFSIGDFEVITENKKIIVKIDEKEFPSNEIKDLYNSRWKSIVLNFEGTNLEVFLNGELISISFPEDGLILNGDLVLSFGTYDSFAIYDKDLLPEEVYRYFSPKHYMDNIPYYLNNEFYGYFPIEGVDLNVIYNDLENKVKVFYDERLIGVYDTGTLLKDVENFHEDFPRFVYLENSDETIVIETSEFEMTEDVFIFSVNPLILEIETTTPNQEFKLYHNSNYSYNYLVSWGDGVEEQRVDSGEYAAFTFETPGKHEVQIFEDFPALFQNDDPDNAKMITSIKKWGSAEIKDLYKSFQSATNLEYVHDDINLNLSETFSLVSSFENISADKEELEIKFLKEINITNINDFSNVFKNANLKDIDISTWDFANANDFSYFLEGVDLSKVSGIEKIFFTNTEIWKYTFKDATIPNNLKNNFMLMDSKNITNMNGMFYNASLPTTFDLRGWNVKNINTEPQDFGDFSNLNHYPPLWGTEGRSIATIIEIEIPNNNYTFNYEILEGNVNIDWGDGDYDQNLNDDGNHVYSEMGTYNIKIISDTDMNINLIPKQIKRSIKQWGNNKWKDLSGVLSYTDLSDYTAIDTPIIAEGVEEAIGWFEGTIINESFGSAIKLWDFSGIKNINKLFKNATLPNGFNFNIELNIENMDEVFYGTEWNSYFNISNWNLEGLESMNDSFSEMKSLFGGELSNLVLEDLPFSGLFSGSELKDFIFSNWEIKGDLSDFFKDAKIEKTEFKNWEIKAGSTGDLFTESTLLDIGFENFKVLNNIHFFNNSSLEDIKIDNWNLVEEDEEGLNYFNSSDLINIELTNWNFINGNFIIDDLFKGLTIEGNLDLTTWDISGVTSFKEIFMDTEIFGDLLIENWDVSNVENFNRIFKNLEINNELSLSSWVVTSALSFEETFFNFKVGDISEWDVSNTENMKGMFKESSGVFFSLEGWNVSNVKYFEEMFMNTFINENINIKKWNTSNGEEFDRMFMGTDLPIPFDLSEWSTVKVFQEPNDFGDFSHSLQLHPSWGTGGLDAGFIFKVETTEPNQEFHIPASGCKYTVFWGDGKSSYDVEGKIIYSFSNPGEYSIRINTSHLGLNINQGPTGNTPELIKEIEQWGSIKWASLEGMFRRTNVNISAIDTPDLTETISIRSIFQDATIPSLYLGEWDLSNVKIFTSAFRSVTSSIPTSISGWDLPAAEDMYGMFLGSDLTNVDLNNWNVSAVKTMSNMFRKALLPEGFNISDWNVSNVLNMNDMFRETNLPEYFDLSGWNVVNIISKPTNFGDFSGENQIPPSWGDFSGEEQTPPKGIGRG